MTSLRRPFGTHAIDTRIPSPSSPPRPVAPTIARLVSERNPHGVARVAKLLERIDAMPAGCDPEALEGCDRAGNPIGGRASNGPSRRARGGPCEWCQRPVPESSQYARWCRDACRRRALGVVVDRPPIPEAQRCIVCRERKRKPYGGKCNGCAGQDAARRRRA